MDVLSWINIKFLLSGLLVTVEVAVISGILSLIIGSIIEVLHYLKIPILSKIIGVVIEILRNLPLLVIIFFTYFALPQVGIRFSVFWSAIIGITLFESAMIAEIIRGGLLSIPSGQMEAAKATGLSNIQALYYVIFPQALRLMLPSIISQGIALIKDTSLATIIMLPELTRKARILYGMNTNYVIPMFVILAVVYFALCYSLSLFAKHVGKAQYA